MLSLVTNYGEVSIPTSALRVLQWQQINFFPVGDGDSNDNVDKKSIKEIETTVYGDSLLFVYWLSTELETADSGTNQQEFNDGCPNQDTKTNQTQNMAKKRGIKI